MRQLCDRMDQSILDYENLNSADKVDLHFNDSSVV